MSDTTTETHPIFLKARTLPEPWRSHFPKSREEAAAWRPMQKRLALAGRVLVVAHTRIECAWCAYVDAVQGYNHDYEEQGVLDNGDKLSESLARAMFSMFDGVEYAP